MNHQDSQQKILSGKNNAANVKYVNFISRNDD